MPLLALPFPAIDPVLISIGPFAIRWYALAYIFGILLGWLYARAHHPQRAAVGRPGADDASPTSTTSCSGSRSASSSAAGSATCCSTIRRTSPRTRWRSCSSGRAACRSTAASSAACSAVMLFALAARHPDPVARRPDLRGRRRSACCSAASPTSSTASCGAAPTDVPWAMVFPGGGPLPRHPSQLYEAALEGAAAAHRARAADPRRRAEAAGPDPRRVRARLRHRAQLLRILPRARSRSSASCGAA